MTEPQQLTYDVLRDAVGGGAVALRSITTLQPVDGPGGKVFPPTYVQEGGAKHKYTVETRLVDGKENVTVLLDSVASQANRAEVALRDAQEAGQVAFPMPYVDFSGASEISGIDRITVLDAPHRLADAIFRDSMLDGTLFRLSQIGQDITEAMPTNATAMFRHAPTALLFGQWDSTGPKGGLGAKFQRAYVSEIVGHDALVGKKVGSRIDPLGIERDAAVIYEHNDETEGWTLNEAEAKQEKGKAARKGDGRPSEINHGNIAPSIDSEAGGVTISKAVQSTFITLAGLRKLRFAGFERDAEVAARTAVAALGVSAIAFGWEADHDLRSRCLLVPQHSPRVELVGRDGSAAVELAVSPEAAAGLVGEAAQRAAGAGIGWDTVERVLTPAPKFVELLRRSQDAAARHAPGEDS